MIELSVNNLVKYYGANKIFENISFDVKTNERIGLIGQNGCGKTTIMKILMGDEDSQGGEVTFRKDCKVGYLNQIPVYENGITSIAVIRSAFSKTYEIKRQMKELEKQFETLSSDELEKALIQYGKLSEQFELDGGYELETKINKITEGLQINETLKEMEFNQLSGGEKTRVMLAKILLEEPDILLLDEPTNHLDLITIDWLEGFLKEYKGSVLIISHDRYFLDKVVNKIVELEFSKANIYLGNYSYFVIEKERRFLIELRNYQNQQKKIDQMERQIERYRIWGEMRDSEKMFKKAKELEKRLEKIDVLDRPIIDKRKIRFGQNSLERTGKIVLEIENLKKSFESKELFHDINLTLFYQDSACIIGKNGCGKTTLLKMILNEIEPDHGTIRLGAQVKIGYLPQQVEYENEEQTLLEYFSGLHNITYEAARSQLAKVLFLKEDVNKKIKFLSGGEKSRLKLCSLTFQKVNVLILDEPTNHLDIDSREVLEETLKDFEGTLLFVSHDRYFINKVADKIIEIEKNCLKIYDGDYNYYIEEYEKCHPKIIEESRETKKDTVKNKCNEIAFAGKQKQKMNNAPSTQSGKKLDLLEKEIEDMEEKIKVLDHLMETNNSNVVYLRELFDEKEALTRQLSLAYEKWETFIF
jgi:ATP-binding cassette, subfamily F, member 3